MVRILLTLYMILLMPGISHGEIDNMTNTGNKVNETVETAWYEAAEIIETRLNEAMKAYEKGETMKAKDLVLKAQFEGYKNTRLIAAVKRYISTKRSYQINSRFSDIVVMIKGGEPQKTVKTSVLILIQDVREDIQELPVIRGMKSEKAVEKEIPETDWAQVKANIFTEIERALSLYRKGERKPAMELVKNSYFDIFEKSGLDEKINTSDGRLKDDIDVRYNRIVELMKNGVHAGNIQETMIEMKTIFEKSMNRLDRQRGKGGLLFNYPLMSIPIVAALAGFVIIMLRRRISKEAT